MRKGVIAVLAAGCLLSAVGCRKKTAFFYYEDIKCSEWDKSDVITFHVPKLKAGGLCQPTVMVRTNDNYGYQNLNLLVEICGKDVIRKDTVTLYVFDKEGRNKGDGLIHTEFRKPLKPIMADTLEYTVRIANLMSKSPLDGVSGIGLGLRYQ